MKTRGGDVVAIGILVLVVAGTVPAAATPTAVYSSQLGAQGSPVLEEEGITGVTYSGEGIAAREDGLTYVWGNGSTWLRVTIQPFQDTRTHDVCLAANRTGGNVSEDNRTVREYGCKEKTLGSVGTRVKFDLDPLGINETGRYDLVVTVRGGDRVDNATVPVFVLERDGDIDGDGLSNAAELERGADLNEVDTDSDGLQDGPEVHSYGTDPTAADTDADGLRDAVEVQGDTDPTEPDTDGDGLADGAEVNEYGTDPTEADTDGDGLADGAEVTEHHTDPTEADTDGDGLSDGEEVNRYETNPIEADTDGDGYTDGEEVLHHRTDPRNPDEKPAVGPLGGLTDLQSTSGLGALLVVGALSAGGVVAYRRMRGPSTPTEPLEDGQADDPTAEEILSPEERVHRLLDDHGGKIRQREIVELTDWSKAKVSRILSRMEDSGGDIERTRIGRENVVTLAEDPTEDVER